MAPTALRALLLVALAWWPISTAAAAPTVPARPAVASEVRHDTSPPLLLLHPGRAVSIEVPPRLVLPHRGTDLQTSAAETPLSPEIPAGSLGPEAPSTPMPSPLVSFDGVGNVDSLAPPDTNGDIGPHHYVQYVNASFAVYDRSGALLFGPVHGSTLWAGFGGICETHDNGDPIVLYDQLADRWLLSQLAFTFPNDFHQCIAISATGDPTGSWHRYDFLMSTTNLNDYPKFAVWPDAYYLAYNQFDGATQGYRGQGVAAFERDQMLLGNTARMVQFDEYAINPNFGGALPADLEGPILPPAGSPAYFVEVEDDTWGWPDDRLQLFKFHVDWSNPAASTYGNAGQPNAIIHLTGPGQAFDANMCGYIGSCIPQPSGSHLDALSDRLMNRLGYRNYGDHESLTVNHTVDADGTDHAGVRWYEIRDPGSASPIVQQLATYAPDANHRWMASMAMDGAGGLAIGYSISSSTIHPSIRYAGRTAFDAPGTLPLTEGSLVAGTGSQSGTTRWGDYSSMSVDPIDDCTFWYTQEYYSTFGSAAWKTRIGAFRLDGCRSCPLLGRPSLRVNRSGTGVALTWTPANNAIAYDVTEGDLGILRAGSGDYAGAITSCPGSAIAATSLLVGDGAPAAGQGFFYLVRGTSYGCEGTFDDPGGSASGRDGGIAASASACP